MSENGPQKRNLLPDRTCFTSRGKVDLWRWAPVSGTYPFHKLLHLPLLRKEATVTACRYITVTLVSLYASVLDSRSSREVHSIPLYETHDEKDTSVVP